MRHWDMILQPFFHALSLSFDDAVQIPDATQSTSLELTYEMSRDWKEVAMGWNYSIPCRDIRYYRQFPPLKLMNV